MWRWALVEWASLVTGKKQSARITVSFQHMWEVNYSPFLFFIFLKERERTRERVSVCVCDRERKRERVCV